MQFNNKAFVCLQNIVGSNSRFHFTEWTQRKMYQLNGNCKLIVGTEVMNAAQTEIVTS